MAEGNIDAAICPERTLKTAIALLEKESLNLEDLEQLPYTLSELKQLAEAFPKAGLTWIRSDGANNMPQPQDFLQSLREVNEQRRLEWEAGRPHNHLFDAVELAGEVGELVNVVKKLERKAMGWRGSSATRQQLVEEFGDVMSCLDKLAAGYRIDLRKATAAKFNQVSVKFDMPHRL